MIYCDYIIIGFGKGGKTLAGELAAEGKSVAIVEESEEMYGGTCINIACIPTKYLIHQANKKNEQNKQEFYKHTIENKNEVTAALRKKNYDSLADQHSVTVYTAHATFISNKKVQLTSETETIDLTADYFIINTGSVPSIPPIEGIENTKYIYTSTELQEVTELPDELVIAGGGNIGLEFASLYATLGSKITIIDSNKEFLEGEDRDIAEEVKSIFQKMNISIISNSKVAAVENEGDQVKIMYEASDESQGELSASALLLATGRKPNTEKLGLDKAVVKVDNQGGIIVDENLKTSAEHIWSIGDVNGGPQFTYISLDDYRVVKSQILGDGDYSLNQRKNVPQTIFIEPPLSQVGLNETEAKEKNIDYQVATMPAAAIPQTKINQQPNGLLKILVDSDTEKILGCTLFCAASNEMINLVRIVMEAELPYTILRDNIYTHPTMSEAFNNLLAEL